MKAAAAVGTALAIEPALGKVQSAERIIDRSSVAKNPDIENRVAAIPIVGDRYNAEQQRQVGH